MASSSQGLSAGDIRYNLDILAGKVPVKGLVINTISIEFLELFATQIQQLDQNSSQVHKSVTQDLNDQLAVTAGRVYESIERGGGPLFSLQPVVVPLIGQALITPATVAASYGPGTKVKAGLNKLQGHYNVLKVKGDGHCMFRGIAYGLAKHYAAGDSNVKMACLTALESLKRDYPALSRDIDRVIEIFSKQASAQATMSTKATSDYLVSFLRKLACAYNAAHPSDVFQSNLIVRGESMQTYFRKMTDMNPDRAVYGGQPELVALSTVLGLKISIIDALVQDSAQIHTTDINPPQALNSGMNRPSVMLLYRPGHYDVLLPV
jgi:hypothetical protein